MCKITCELRNFVCIKTQIIITNLSLFDRDMSVQMSLRSPKNIQYMYKAVYE
jgi:hypothetical protein